MQVKIKKFFYFNHMFFQTLNHDLELGDTTFLIDLKVCTVAKKFEKHWASDQKNILELRLTSRKV